MAGAESEEAVRLRNKAFDMPKSLRMAEAESEEVVRLLNKASEMPKSPSSIELPASKEPQSSYFLTKSLAEMVNDDPIRLRNQSCVILEEIVQTLHGEQLIYSSLAHLPTFSIGLSSTEGEAPPRTPLRESSVDLKDKSPPRYFQMPELGARVFVGNVDGFDTITCHLLDEAYYASEFDLDSEYAAVRSVYKDDRPGGLSSWFRAQPVEFWRSALYSKVILSGTELFCPFRSVKWPRAMVGNLGGKSSRVSSSSSDYKDCGGDETIRQPSDVVEQPGDLIPGVHYLLPGHWKTIEGPDLFRLRKGSYLRKPLFMKWDDLDLSHAHSESHVLQLTRFDDFVILGTIYFYYFLPPYWVIDIVRKNASKTVDVIAAQLVKGAMAIHRTLYPFTVIVIFLDHKEILLKDHIEEKKENMAPRDIDLLSGLFELKAISQSVVLRGDKEIVESKEEEKIPTLKEEEKVFALDMEDKKGIMTEEDDKVEILVGEPLPNVPQISIVLLEENKFRKELVAINPNLPSAKMQDDFEASSSVVLIEDDDYKSKEFMVPHDITKWIIYGDHQTRTLLCFFNVEEMQYEFYFEDHESMATIIGLGVPHSKVILECESPHVVVVEILEEDWNAMWTHSNDIPHSISKGYVLKQERFLDILYCIVNVINTNNIVSKANNSGVGRNNGKDKAHGNVDDHNGKGKAHNYDDHGNTSHRDGGSNDTSDDNDNKERKGKDGNNDNNNSCDRDDGRTSNDYKEVQAVVHLRLLPGGVLEDKEKQKKGEVHYIEVDEKKKDGEGSKGVEKKKKKKRKRFWHAHELGVNGNVVGNQQEWTITEEVHNGDADENLEKQLEKQIHSQMVFTFTIKDEAGGSLKTIQATIDPITFQLPFNNEENYLQRRRFGWFHKKLQVAFGVVDIQVADLDPKSCKVLDSSKIKEVNLQGNLEGNSRTNTNAIKGELGIRHGVIASAGIGKTGGSEAHTTKEVQNTWEINKPLTKGGFSISKEIDLNAQQLKYSYFPHCPFNEKEFEVKDEDDRVNMYKLNPICQLQQVSCEGTWHPDDSKNLEAYKLEVSREIGMTRIYNSKPETRVEKMKKGIRKVENSLPLCFIQKLEKVVYLNHAMSHLTSSIARVYRLKEQQDPSNPSTSIFTQAQNKRELEWPSNDPLVDVKQSRRNI